MLDESRRGIADVVSYKPWDKPMHRDGELLLRSYCESIPLSDRLFYTITLESGTMLYPLLKGDRRAPHTSEQSIHPVRDKNSSIQEVQYLLMSHS